MGQGENREGKSLFDRVLSLIERRSLSGVSFLDSMLDWAVVEKGVLRCRDERTRKLR